MEDKELGQHVEKGLGLDITWWYKGRSVHIYYHLCQHLKKMWGMGIGPLINLHSTRIILATEKQNYCVWIKAPIII